MIPACTAVRLTSASGAPYFFRTCDRDTLVCAEPFGFPRGAALRLSHETHTAKHAFFGMTYRDNPLWLLDGCNSAGLAGGLLLLDEGTSLAAYPQGIVGMELVTAMLAECDSVAAVCRKAQAVRVLDIPHGGEHVPATMHWFFADAHGASVILEAATPEKPGELFCFTPQLGVLTNSPPYPAQLDHLRWFLAQSPALAEKIALPPDPAAPHLRSGDPLSYASQDRFLRAAALAAIADGRFSDEEMPVCVCNLMHPLFVPQTDGLLANGFTQYLVLYNLRARRMYVRAHDALSWSTLAITELPYYPCRFSLPHDPRRGIFPLAPQREPH